MQLESSPVRVRPAKKPLSLSSAVMLYGLGEMLALFLIGFATVLGIGGAVLAGVLFRSLGVGLLVGIPVFALLWIWGIWIYPRVIHWTVNILGYSAPGLWQTWAALAWGTWGSLLVSAIWLIPVGILTSSSQSSDLKLALLVFSLLVLPSVNLTLKGWLLLEAAGRSLRACRIVSQIFVLSQVLLGVLILSASGIIMNRVHGMTGSGADSKRALANTSGISTAYRLDHAGYNNRTLLAREICLKAPDLRVEAEPGANGDCRSLIPAAWQASWTPPKGGGRTRIWIGQVTEGQAQICAASPGDPEIYCNILRGPGATWKGFSDQNLGQALRGARKNLGY